MMILNRSLLSLLVSSLLLVFSQFVFAEINKNIFVKPMLIPTPENNKLTNDRILLGKMLFFDPRLSGSNWISCATCHNPALGWTDGLPTAIGHDMKVLGRSTPTILNSAYQHLFTWDGRKRSLEDQALEPIEAVGEMNQNLDELVKELNAIPGYVSLFKKAYPKRGLKKQTIGLAIASFERTIVATESPFDRWLAGIESAMAEDAVAGFNLFVGKGRCVICHQGHSFSDNGFHNLGLKNNKDIGRFGIVPVKISQGAFKTPTLRDVALTAPYMHNGIYQSLEEVVQHYNRSGDEKNNLDPNMQPLGLNQQEVNQLVAFLRSLTGNNRPIDVPALPQ